MASSSDPRKGGDLSVKTVISFPALRGWGESFAGPPEGKGISVPEGVWTVVARSVEDVFLAASRAGDYGSPADAVQREALVQCVEDNAAAAAREAARAWRAAPWPVRLEGLDPGVDGDGAMRAFERWLAAPDTERAEGLFLEARAHSQREARVREREDRKNARLNGLKGLLPPHKKYSKLAREAVRLYGNGGIGRPQGDSGCLI